jgi:hypothetical protein
MTRVAVSHGTTTELVRRAVGDGVVRAPAA